MFFFKIKLTHYCFKSSPSIYSNGIDHAYFLHFSVAQLTPSHPFLLPGAASRPTNVAMPPRRIMFSSHGAKMSSLPPLIFWQRFVPSHLLSSEN
jgi:hypothetical protein